MKAKITCRLVYTVGGKGGGGKSFCVSLLTQYLDSLNITYKLYDCDDETSTTSRLFPQSAKFLAIRSASEIDHLVQTATEGKVEVVLVDLPARAGDEFQNWFSIVPWDELATLGVRFTSIGVVSGAKDSIEAILRWCEFVGSNVDHVLALNRRDDLSIYESSNARCKFRSEGVPEIEIPKLDERFAAALDRANWPISTALASSEPHFLTQLMSRARLRRYRDQVFTQFETIKHLLIP
jgi:hypothetical protein